MNPHLRGLLFALALTVATPGIATTTVTAIVGATVVDVSRGGHGDADVVDAVVLVRAGRIVAVGRRGVVALPRHARVIHAEGRYLLPGLIDGFGALRTPGFADAYLYEGVTTVYVAQAPPGGGVDGEARVIAPRNGLSLLTGVAIGGYATDGRVPAAHPWIAHRAQDRPLDDATLVATVDAAADAGHRGLTLGFDVLPHQLDVIVAAARRRHLATTAELGFTPYDHAVAAGVDALLRNDKYQLALAPAEAERAYADDPLGSGGRPAARALCDSGRLAAATDAFGIRLASSHTALMPMLAMEATADDVGGPDPWTLPAAAFVRAADLDDPVDPATGARPYLDSHPDRREAIRACARQKQATDARLHRAGARFLAGTQTPGYGVLPGSGLHVELALLQHEAGLTPREALAAASGNFAEVYGWTDRGAVAAGRRADPLLLDADPRRDVAALDRIAMVMADGMVIDRAALRRRAQKP